MWMPNRNMVFYKVSPLTRLATVPACQMSLSIIWEIQRFYQHPKRWGTKEFVLQWTQPRSVVAAAGFGDGGPLATLCQVYSKKTFQAHNLLPPHPGFGSQSVLQESFPEPWFLLGKTVLYRTLLLVSMSKSHVHAKNMKSLGVSHFLPPPTTRELALRTDRLRTKRVAFCV